MRIVVGADHAGFDLKEFVKKELQALGHDIQDVGSFDPQAPDDYPDFALALGQVVQARQAEKGVLICGSGVGASVAANKIPGIRAAICHDAYSAHQGVEHDDMNVLVLGARIVGSELARELVRSFLGAQYTGEERHARRLAKVLAIEAQPPQPGV
ncbi:MAG: ribose 5-phosphate isomerase B [Bacteroidales bacterium]|nr:ribose 5-phosphate isomerase B [Bacteroidales bacterium]